MFALKWAPGLSKADGDPEKSGPASKSQADQLRKKLARRSRVAVPKSTRPNQSSMDLKLTSFTRESLALVADSARRAGR